MRRWLLVTAALVFVMTLVGGATRLTGSGLSITEWLPVSGAIPPLSPADWDVLFAKYRAISQFMLQNPDMTLSGFKFIFWWEWGHRQLGRFIGLFYLGGFLWFLLRRRISGARAGVLFLMGLLLAAQGAVGWIMVASGLQPGMTAVAPVKLTLHLTLAMAFFASLIWMAGREAAPSEDESRHSGTALALIALVFLQIALGGLVAGLKAGLVYNTWPLMNGALVPSSNELFFHQPWFLNFFDSHALVQLNHRLGAYLLLAFAAWHAFALRRAAPGTRGARSATGLFAAVSVQAAAGVMTLLLHVPLWAGLLHQALGALVLLAAVRHALLLRQQP